MSQNSEKIAVVGLGYVGLPVAMALAAKFDDVVGFDISARRVGELRKGIDATGEMTAAEMAASRLIVTDDPVGLDGRDFFIVTVPTPIDAALRPDLAFIESACRLVGKCLRPGGVVVFESTVYPGLTEDVCGPLLERASNLTRGTDFTLGYSPERINPGDRAHRLASIVKVIAAEDERTLARLRAVYGAIIDAGLHEAPSIRVAEAAKVIENTQRDLNIALLNEFALIFDRMDIRTADVLAAAGTKWNFLRFSPGLVGGHCIGVDPYYLTHAAQALGYDPQVILAGRRINNGMSGFVAAKALALAVKPAGDLRVGVLGLTFKENVPDLRNSKVPDIVTALVAAGAQVLVHDPMADAAEAAHEYGLPLSDSSALTDLDVLILAVPHAAYDPLAYDIAAASGAPAVIDVRSMLDRRRLPADSAYWSL